VVLVVPWRDEFLSRPERDTIHGGILASVVDTAGVCAIATRTGRLSPTVDLRIDYHRAGVPGELRAEASVIALGRTLACAETRVFDVQGRLAASGRAVYFVGTSGGDR